ncbi:MAG: biosynthetic arginine decarboxylase [Gammaproteobacteria bacterium]|nr:biosynthetic arginine decarboxylase [Gammaproteobacteria bacterium]
MKWSTQDSRNTYNIHHWSSGYFDINSDGNACALPQGKDGPAIDLFRIAHEIKDSGLTWPVLVRFTDILHQRVGELCGAFDQAIRSQEYKGHYTAIYPIKVNQQRTVVEHLLSSDRKNVGLEAGSKPELMVVLAHSRSNTDTIICNGYKDREYIRLALIGRKLGHRIYIVIEKLSELKLILEESASLGIEPLLGVRVRLSSIGKGKWQNTGGEKSKFGLSSSQVLEVAEQLKAHKAEHTLRLVHCHLGSQLANIRDIQKGLSEVARYYAELHKLGIPIETVDIGGGLGIDYEGTRSRNYCSMNYSIQEYANDVVHSLWQICDDKQLPHPNIISESGRALTAHHAVLITNVVDQETTANMAPPTRPDNDAPIVIHNMWHTYSELSDRSELEAYHDAIHLISEAQTAFLHGLVSLEQRAHAEQLYTAICRKIQPMLQSSRRSHREILDELNEKLADKFFCNLSIFQSMPDVWAIDQIFPIMPLHRLDEQPERRATIHDMTCDSDGAVEHYVDCDGIESTLPVHSFATGETYLFGIFLVGAYQEILGDLHNLFGDTHSINVELNIDGSYHFAEAEEGDTVNEVLSYVHYNKDVLMQRYRSKLGLSELDDVESQQILSELEAGLNGYTYLED